MESELLQTPSLLLRGGEDTDSGSGQASCIDTGDTTWVMVCTVLVLGMMPALAFFEAGLLRAKNTLSIITQIFVGIALMAVLWHLIGFTLVFGPDYGGMIGGPRYAAFRDLENNCLEHAPNIPGLSFALFQMMFAAISPLLMTGAFAERIKFKVFIALIVWWEVLVYYPLAHWIWGGGWLADRHVMDFAGGIVIHVSSGVSSLVMAIVLGKRQGFEKYHGEYPPSNIPLASVGAALLWMGWYGFNAGSALTAGAIASRAVGTTTVASCTSLLTWVLLNLFHARSFNTIAVLNGAIAGLAGITPASGYIRTSWASLIGVVLGLSSFYSIKLFKGVLKIDDALDVSSVHGVTGLIGSLSIGIFAESSLNTRGYNGWIHGNPSQMYIQLLGVVVALAWAAFWTFIFVLLARWAFGSLTPRLEEERQGLDALEHGHDPAYHNLHRHNIAVEDEFLNSEEEKTLIQ
ncbi:Ammonium transporter [Balamuthia mandrillaris]